MTVPEAGEKLCIRSLANATEHTINIKEVSLLGHQGDLVWQQTEEGLEITCPENMPFKTAIVFKVTQE